MTKRSTNVSPSSSHLSRRSFVEVAVGAISVLPAVAGQVLLTPSGIAYAEESAGVSSEVDGGDATNAKTVKIIAAKPYESSFIVTDMADGGATYVKGARVRVTSRSNNKSVEGTTNDQGLVLLDISSLCPDQAGVSDKHKLTNFEFDGSVSITCAGYRDCDIQLMNLDGGMVYEVPTRKLTEGMPYPSSAALNGWDVLYSKNEFLCMDINDETQSMSFTIKNLGGGATTVSIVPGKDAAAIASTTVTPQNGVATANFSQKFLKKGARTALTDAQKNYIKVENGGKTYLTPLSLKLSAGLGEKPQSKKNVSLAPLSTDAKAVNGLGLKWPKALPVIGGSAISVWTPDLPVNVDYNPFGYLRVTVPILRGGVEANTDKGKTNQGFSLPRKSVADQFKKLTDTAKSMSDKTGNALAKSGNIQKIDTFGVVSCKVNLQVVLGAQWENSQKLYRFTGGLQVFASMSASYTLNYLLGPVPALVVFGFDCTADASGTMGALVQNPQNGSVFNALIDFNHFQWDPANTGMSLRISPVISVSVGVGVRGVASVSVKGSAGLVFFIGWSPAAAQRKLPVAHVIFGYVAKVELVVHLFLFTKNFLLLDGSKPAWYDNWKINAQADDGLTEYLYEDYTLKQLADALVPIEDFMLDEMIEEEGDDAIVDYGIPADIPDGWENEDDGGQTGGGEWYDIDYLDSNEELQGLSAASEGTTRRVYGKLVFEQEGDITEPLDGGSEADYYVYSFGVEPIENNVSGQGGSASGVQLQSDGSASDKGQPSGEAKNSDSAAATGGSSTSVPTAPLEELPMDANDATTKSGAVAAAVAFASGNEIKLQEGTVRSEEMGVEDVTPNARTTGTASDAATGAQGSAQAPNVANDADALGTQELGASDAAAPAADATLSAAAEQDVAYMQDEWASEELRATAEEEKPSVAGLGQSGGLRPSYDSNIFSGKDALFGDPRAKIVSFDLGGDSFTYLFRIGTSRVRVLDLKNRRGSIEPRTRLMATKLEGPGTKGFTYTIDINVNPRRPRDNFDRWNYYDYDFDLEYIPGSQVLAITLVCGKRNAESGSTSGKIQLEGAMSDTAFVFLRVRVNDIQAGARIRNVQNWFVRYANQVLGNVGSDEHHSISNLQCRYRESTMLVTFLDRYAKGNTKNIVTNNASVRLGIMFVNFGASRNNKDAVKVLKWDDVAKKNGITIPADAFEMDVSPLVAGQHTIMLRGGGTASFLLIAVDGKKGVLASIKACKTTYKFDKNNPVGSMLPRLIAWPNHDAFLCTHDGKLQKAVWNNGELQFTPVGPSNYGVSAFGVSRNGNFIFWPQSREGDAITGNNADGDPQTTEEKVYQIMACRIRGEKFSDPFVVADLPHDADQIAIVSVRGAALDLLITEMAKTKQAEKQGQDLEYAARLWRTKIPHTKSVTAIGAETPNLRVAPGGEAQFDVSLRNDGNTFLKGCTIDMYLEGQKVPGSSAQLTFSKSTLRESPWNESDSKGALQNVESDYALAPGKRQVHRVSIPIPADWSGEKRVSFVASAPVLVDEGNLYSQAEVDEGEVREYVVAEPVAAQMDRIDVLEDETEWDYYNDAPVEVVGGGSGGSSSGGSGGSSSGGSSSGGSGGSAVGTARQATPRTADPSVPGALAAGIGAAGAALLAYERRRSRNDRSRDDE